MRQLLTLLRTWPAPQDAWRWLPEFEEMPPAVAEQTWTAAHREIRSDHWTLLSWCGFLTGVALLIERFGTASSGAGDVLCFLAGCWMLGVPVQLGIRRRTRRLVARRLDDGDSRGGQDGGGTSRRVMASARHGAAALALGLALLPSCERAASAAHDDVALRLDQLLRDGDLETVDALLDDPLTTASLDPLDVTLYGAIVLAGQGDCGPAARLAEDDAALDAHRRALLLSRASQQFLRSTTRPEPWSVDTRWVDGAEVLTSDGERFVQRWNERVDTAVCLLDLAQRQFPERAPTITARRDELEAERVDKTALLAELQSWGDLRSQLMSMY